MVVVLRLTLLPVAVASSFVFDHSNVLYPVLHLQSHVRFTSLALNDPGRHVSTQKNCLDSMVKSKSKGHPRCYIALFAAKDDPVPSLIEPNRIDRSLSTLTSAFPVFVLASAVLGLTAPSSLAWVNRGSLISLMLASVMMGTGMTLKKSDFAGVLVENFASVPAGVLCQFCIMPLAAMVVGRTVLLGADHLHGPSLFLGLALVGCSPGGTASNLVSLIAGADVALSVLLTACSTILAAVATPLLVKLLVGSTVRVSGMALCTATGRVVLAPVLMGMLLNAGAPELSKAMARFTPFASVLLVSLICGGVVAQNAASLFQSTVASSPTLLPRIVISVFMMHSLGFLLGFLVPRFGLRYSPKTSRTIAIETGMQNSALAVVLARSIGAPPLASLPGALSATVHSCLGSILAAYWRAVDSKPENKAPVEADASGVDGEGI